ncbi:YjjG family noncanonical pyrimidine nucleotidase [Lacticaseibacillus sharpeae]|uniref:HAD superfamily phosphatase n=1 Tax=Lacticaseibacillus sharpeae JCM 1186 = DSM 20505 TaxID=1291052 RepID=A0A0R1ZZH2_9LACO|nr:YjjG family noncanonical pyrimidine nucleotidase [Lacticaseibacillus sharpeae]KRM56547.1 HAD superfamily phosphatase [Lacticaseibacillus sharpeae JCM 1186 = DSM 20505]
MTTLIFDLDDTLLDFTASEEKGLTGVFADFGIPDNADTRATYKRVNSGLWAALERGELTRAQLLDVRFARFGAAIAKQDFDAHAAEKEYRNFLNNGFDRVPGAKTLLTNLQQRGYRILAGTNGNAATQHNRLLHSHLGPLFDGVYISEEIGYDKPDPRFFDAIFAAEPHIDRNDTIMIGDGLNSDIRGGVDYHLPTIWVNRKHQVNKTELHPTHTVTDLQQLSDLLLNA